MAITDGSTGHAVPLAEAEGRLLDPSTLRDSVFTFDGTLVTDDVTGDLAPFTRSDPAPPPPVTLVSDTFDRPDGPVGTADTGQVWAAVGTGLLVVDHAAGTDDSSRASAIDSGEVDVVVSVECVTAGDEGAPWALFLRRADANNFARVVGNGQVTQRSGGVTTTLGTLSGGAVVDGDTVAVTLDGAALTVARNGGTEFTGTTDVLAGTSHGLSVADTGTRLDNFTVTTL